MSDELTTVLTPTELAFVRRAAEYLERPSFLMRTANVLGKPIESIGKVLPDSVRERVGTVVERALIQSLSAAVATLPRAGKTRPLEDLSLDTDWGQVKHNVAAGVSGALAGTFGLSALAIELPITTTIMMRDIASVALGMGEDLTDPEVKLQCLAVFSLGGNGPRPSEGKLPSMESSYYAARLAMTNVVREAAQYITRVTAQQLTRDLAAGAAPALVRFIAGVALRFDVIVTQKVLAQTMPAIGAAGGALVNVAFNAHFDRVARCHFGIRALERTYGREPVQAAYQSALKQLASSPPTSPGKIEERKPAEIE
jgi:hypothetical protein